MTKQELIDSTRWRVYLGYEGPTPFPDNIAPILTQMASDVSSVTDASALPLPDSSEVVARVYYVSASLPKKPRQTIVLGWTETEPHFSLTTEVA